ncbi:MAG: diacylglycerol kinase [Candidatus Omnitrophica bacterium]|nr:diacylglycerol kinase [Candidatus Omnitrophota bacterium]
MSNIYKHKNFKESLQSAISGLIYTIKTESNARIILILGLISLGLSIWLKLSLAESAIIIITIALVFICETFNTLIEDIMDLLKKEYDPRIKVLKDMASASVLLSSIASLGIGAFIFLPKIIELFR